MFMSKDELSDDEEMGGGDVVVPLSLVASTPQVINASGIFSDAIRKMADPEVPDIMVAGPGTCYDLDHVL